MRVDADSLVVYGEVQVQVEAEEEEYLCNVSMYTQ